MFRIVTAGLVLGLSALPGTAQSETITRDWQCVFTKECLELEACSDTQYEVQVSYDIDELANKPGEAAGTGEIVDQTSTRRATVLHDKEAFLATVFDFEQETTISKTLFQVFASDSGEARLISAQPMLPFVITYHGSCIAGGS